MEDKDYFSEGCCAGSPGAVLILGDKGCFAPPGMGGERGHLPKGNFIAFRWVGG